MLGTESPGVCTMKGKETLGDLAICKRDLDLFAACRMRKVTDQRVPDYLRLSWA